MRRILGREVVGAIRNVELVACEPEEATLDLHAAEALLEPVPNHHQTTVQSPMITNFPYSSYSFSIIYTSKIHATHVGNFSGLSVLPQTV